MSTDWGTPSDDPADIVPAVGGPPRAYWSTSAILIGLAWLAVAAIGVAYGLHVWRTGDVYCQVAPKVYDYGELSWSVLPPGPVCTFTADAHGFDGVRGPYPVMSIWLLVLVVGAVAFVVARRRARARWRTLQRVRGRV